MDEGLKLILEGMQKEIGLMRADIRTLLEKEWMRTGRTALIGTVFGVIGAALLEIVTAIIQSKGG